MRSSYAAPSSSTLTTGPYLGLQLMRAAKLANQIHAQCSRSASDYRNHQERSRLQKAKISSIRRNQILCYSAMGKHLADMANLAYLT